MSKKTSKNKKEILIEKTKSNRMDSKTYYMRNTFTSCYLDCNNVGNVYFSLNEPCKWEFKKTETQGAYVIRHINTNLYLTSDDHGDLLKMRKMRIIRVIWKMKKIIQQKIIIKIKMKRKNFVSIVIYLKYLMIKNLKVKYNLITRFIDVQ